ncbi:hypothetical protein LUZ63_002531 [Rhynchospora breviuscula]|uniref:ALOG domain-containing protein n=1 Tax=Rhynchospora breviuscula TaxID=2022672 RepID=A0A9Q0CYW4_9POAL|nr:hypothetical protein LUZ63_002531 [Rhynchospora breviuscula]
MSEPVRPSRYESQKRRDWRAFGEYLINHRPPLSLSRCSGAHVLEFLRHVDRSGKTRVHVATCPFFGCPNPPAPCPCPLRQAWGSLDSLVGRLRAAYEESGGPRESNPFATRAVRLYLRGIRDAQARARGISYKGKKKKGKKDKVAMELDEKTERPAELMQEETQDMRPFQAFSGQFGMGMFGQIMASDTVLYGVGIGTYRL